VTGCGQPWWDRRLACLFANQLPKPRQARRLSHLVEQPDVLLIPEKHVSEIVIRSNSFHWLIRPAGGGSTIRGLELGGWIGRIALEPVGD